MVRFSFLKWPAEFHRDITGNYSTKKFVRSRRSRELNWSSYKRKITWIHDRLIGSPSQPQAGLTQPLSSCTLWSVSIITEPLGTWEAEAGNRRFWRLLELPRINAEKRRSHKKKGGKGSQACTVGASLYLGNERKGNEKQSPFCYSAGFVLCAAVRVRCTPRARTLQVQHDKIELIFICPAGAVATVTS